MNNIRTMNNKVSTNNKNDNISNNGNDNNITSFNSCKQCFFISCLKVFKLMFLFIEFGNLFLTEGATYERLFCHMLVF